MAFDPEDETWRTPEHCNMSPSDVAGLVGGQGVNGSELLCSLMFNDMSIYIFDRL